jgi:hypothetical protein
VTLALTFTTYGVFAATENVFCAWRPAPSSYSNCARQVPFDSFCDVSANGAAASFAETAASSTARVNGRGASDGACPATISYGCRCSSRYFFSCQLLSVAPRVVKTPRTSAFSTTTSRAGVSLASAGVVPCTDGVGLAGAGVEAFGAVAVLLACTGF